MYKVKLEAGQSLDVGMRRTGGDLIPFTVLLDADGNLVQFGDDNLVDASTLKYTSRSAGTYYVVTGGYIEIDFDSGTTTVTKGKYDLTATTRAGDRDLYAVKLRAGDVLGANVTDAAGYVSVFDSKGVEVHGSGQDATYIYPENSPLPGGGNATTDHVAAKSGTYYVEVTQGDGSYQAQLEVYRYGGAAKKQTQTIFLDTDGAATQHRDLRGSWGHHPVAAAVVPRQLGHLPEQGGGPRQAHQGHGAGEPQHRPEAAAA